MWRKEIIVTNSPALNPQKNHLNAVGRKAPNNARHAPTPNARNASFIPRFSNGLAERGEPMRILCTESEIPSRIAG
jgi:hypothetical protein